jgi:hypothetical protein
MNGLQTALFVNLPRVAGTTRLHTAAAAAPVTTALPIDSSHHRDTRSSCVTRHPFLLIAPGP